MALWHHDAGGDTSYPFGAISCYNDQDFTSETPQNPQQFPNNCGGPPPPPPPPPAPPSVSLDSVTPGANGYGWNNENVTIHWIIENADTRSAECGDASGNYTLTQETAGTSPTCTVTQNGDGSASASVPNPIRIDKTAPGIDGSASPAPNGNGWNNTDVTAHFTCYDQGPVQSGIASCTADQLITGEGRNLTRSGTAVDKADNSDTASVSVNIDRTPPVTAVTLDPPTPNGKRGWYISDVTVCLPASDPILADGSAGSGVAGTKYRINGGEWQDYDAGCFVVGTEDWDNDVDFYSIDKADNVESEKDVHFKLDKTPPAVDINEGILDGLHWDQVHLERGLLTNTNVLAETGDSSDNLCLWEVRAVDTDIPQTLDTDAGPGQFVIIIPPPVPMSMVYDLDAALHVGINNTSTVAEDCAGWEADVDTQEVYVIPGPYDPRSKGFWAEAVATGKYTLAEMETLLSYINVVSDTWGPAVRNIYGPLTTGNYQVILNYSATDMEQMQKAQLLANWFNLVSGRVAVLTDVDMTKVKGWSQVVDNTGGSPMTFALNVPMEIEEVDQTRLATRAVYQIAKNLAEAFNLRKIIP
jgi:hypothetical protein